MLAQTVQLRVTLSSKILSLLQDRASKLGLTMSAYVKNLVITDIKAQNYPEFEPSQNTIEACKNGQKEIKAGKIKKIEKLSDFFNKL